MLQIGVKRGIFIGKRVKEVNLLHKLSNSNSPCDANEFLLSHTITTEQRKLEVSVYDSIPCSCFFTSFLING